MAGIFERNGQVCAERAPDRSKAALQGIIRGRVDAKKVMNSKGWRGYNGRVDLGRGLFRVGHSKGEFARGRVHINGTDGFLGHGKGAARVVQGAAETHLSLAPQRNQMALQPPRFR